MSESPTYKSWRQMKRRCNLKSDKSIYYKDRGIAVCERWLSFDNFLADMGERPPQMTLDRIDANGDYCPANCRWADRYTQARNKRTNVVLELDGTRRCASEWAEALGIDRDTIRRRIQKGWPLHEVLRGKQSRHHVTSQRGSK